MHPGAETVEKVSKATFSTRIHPAARIISLPVADKFHTCRAKSVFSHVHAAAENRFYTFRAYGAKLCEAFSMR